MVLVEIDVGIALNQRMELKQFFAENLGEKAVVKAALVEYAHIGLAADYIADHINRAGLEDGELILVGVKALCHASKGLGHKGVVLG